MAGYRGGLTWFWWDFQSYGAVILGETVTLDTADDPAEAWRKRYEDGGEGNPYELRAERDPGDSGATAKLKGDMPAYDGSRLLNIAGFRGHTPAVYHACNRHEWLFGSIEDAVSNVIVWLYDEWHRTGSNPADRTGHWPDANDYVCKQARRALSEAARNEAPVKSERIRVNGKRQWTHGNIQVVRYSPVYDDSDESEEFPPPWELAATWGQPNNPMPALIQAASTGVETTVETLKRELLEFVIDQVLTGLRQDAIINRRPADSITADVIERIRLNPRCTGDAQDGQIDGRTVRDVADELGVGKSTVQRAIGRFSKLMHDKAEAYGWNMSLRPSTAEVAKARHSYGSGSGRSGGIWYGGDDKMPSVLRGVMR